MNENKTLTPLCVENVDRIFSDCLFRTHEEHKEYVANGGHVTMTHTLISPIAKVAFHAERLENHREEIKEMLMQLPDGFFKDKGGGWSFLNMCEDKTGELWTGFQAEAQKLALLGLATGQMSLLLPPEELHILPGGMPYLCVEI